MIRITVFIRRRLGKGAVVSAVLRSVLTLDLLVFSVTGIITLLISLHARLESLSLAMSHQDSNIKMVVWNHPYWTKALVEHLRDLQNRCLYLWNRCFSFFQLTRTTPLWGIVALLASDILCSWYKYFRVHINGHWSCLCLPDEYLLE